MPEDDRAQHLDGLGLSFDIDSYMDTKSTQEIDLGNLAATSLDNSADPSPLLREEHGRLAYMRSPMNKD